MALIHLLLLSVNVLCVAVVSGLPQEYMTVPEFGTNSIEYYSTINSGMLPLTEIKNADIGLSLGAVYPCFHNMCNCTNTTADCSRNGGNLTFVPKFPDGITFLIFAYNEVLEIPDDFFLNVTNITGLDLSHNGIAVIRSGAFRPLEKLHSLILSFNNIPDCTALEALVAIQNLTTLDVQHNNLGRCNLSVFASLRNLRSLVLAHSKIHSVETEHPVLIEHLDLHKNPIASFPGTCSRNISSLFPQLEKLNLWGTDIDSIPASVCLPNLRVLNLGNSQIKTLKNCMFETRRFPSLKELYLDNLRTIDTFEQYPIMNEGLVVVSLAAMNSESQTDINKNISTVFVGCSSVNTLTLSDFGNANKLREIVDPLRNLRYIDLGNNNIDSIDLVTSVPGLHLLHTLILTGNQMSSLDGLAVFANLVDLDVSCNHLQYLDISWISPDLVRQLSRLDLSGNPYRCTCDLWYLKIELTMLIDSPLLNSPRSSYTCTNDSLTSIPIESYTISVRECRDIVNIICVISLIFGGFILCFCCFLMFCRCRRTIRPMLYDVFRGPGNIGRVMRPDDYRYDVFVSYASEDEDFIRTQLIPQLEGRLRLRLCLHFRDFHPGREIMGNITESLEVSRKVMVIFSTNFAQSPWCQFELTLCLTHVMDNADNMLVVYLHDIPPRELTNNMLAVLRTCTYLQWSNEPRAMATFWSRLGATLRGLR